MALLKTSLPQLQPRLKLQAQKDAMWCDMTSIFTTKINGGPYQMKFWNGHWIISFIKCKDSMCTPAYYGPTHACQYICGQNECP